MAATAYIAASDITTAYGYVVQRLLSGRDGNVADGDSVAANAKLLAAIETANARVDASVVARYSPAAVSDNAILKDAAMSIAIYTLATRARTEVAEAWVANYNRAIEFLRDVQKGSAKLGLDLDYPPTHRDQDARGAVAVTAGFDVTASDAQSVTNTVVYERF